MHTARKAILDADVLQHGHFVFADGEHALVKLEMDNLWHQQKELDTILDLLGEAKDLPSADVIIGVPTGGQRLAQELVASGRVKLPIALLERVPGGAKQDFRFITKEDEALVRAAKSVRVYEDVVTTLSSIAGAVKLLDTAHQDVHSLAIWRRGEVKEKYRKGVSDHYLVEEILPSVPADRCEYPNCK